MEVNCGSGNGESTIFRRIKHEAKDGRPTINYRIQLIDESLFDETLLFMGQHFLANENITSCIGVLGDKEATEEAHDIWRKYLSKKVSLGAFLVDDKGNRGPMISCNVLDVSQNGEEEPVSMDSFRTEKWRKIFKTLAAVEEQVSVFWKFECQAYVHAVGLVVAPEFERRGIGFEMLGAREDVCRFTNTQVSATVFTGEASQRLALRHGWQVLSELDITTFTIDGQIVYSNPKSPVIKLMAKRYFH
nr:PREDICTED: uncharacterized protein LOC109042628 [Bemisia tabaci]XP_018915044.1 PREDICTED: uncharacterized protein LOC109042628 [Bemisia tabaci]